MMCDKCKKHPATTHIKTVVNGRLSEINLCSFCAAEEGYGSFGKLSLANMLASMFGESIEGGKTKKERCNCCQSTFADIVESGRVGCSECYTLFRKELMPSLNRLHGKVKHVGQVPEEKETEKETISNQVETLRESLKKAIDAEEYEKAAKIRDEIRALEGMGEE